MMKRAPDELHNAGVETPLALRRAWPRDNEHLLCEYASANGGPVAAQWFADPHRLRAVAATTPGDIEILESAGVLLQRGGADRRLAALRPLVAAQGAALVVHRPERRAVVRHTDGGETTYVKVMRPGRTGELIRHAALVAAQASGAFRTPRPCACDDGRGIIVWDELTGRSLFTLGAASEAAEGWQSAGRALARLHDGAVPGLQTHRARDEAALVQRWLSQAAAFGLLPDVDTAQSLAPLLDDPPAPLGLLHRDLHDKQLVHQPGTPIGLLDVDTLAVGERALDLANLLVHVELRARQSRLGTAAARTACEAFLQAYRPDASTRRRLDAYAVASRLRLAAVYAFRPRWRAVAQDLLTDALGASGHALKAPSRATDATRLGTRGARAGSTITQERKQEQHSG